MLPPFIDSLEPRRLLNANFNSGTGVLTVVGSTGADVIDLSSSGGNIVVTISPEGFNQSFAASSITAIDVLCDDGNDLLTTDAAISININAFGDNGRDTL